MRDATIDQEYVTRFQDEFLFSNCVDSASAFDENEFNEIVAMSRICRALFDLDHPKRYFITDEEVASRIEGCRANFQLHDRIVLVKVRFGKAAGSIQRHNKSMDEAYPSGILSPDFICNLLAALSGLNRLGERERLENALFALSRLFYYMDGKSAPVLLRNEFRFVETYLALQKVRFGDNLTYSIYLDAAVSSFPVARYALFNLVSYGAFQDSNGSAAAGNIEVRCRSGIHGMVELLIIVDGKERISTIQPEITTIA